MANIMDSFASNYVDKEMIREKGGKVRVIIDHVDIEEIGQDKQRKPVAYFRGASKAMVLNKGNSQAIADAYGGDYLKWGGRALLLIYDARVEYQGKRVGGIRVDIPDDELAKLGSSQPDKSTDIGKGTDATLEEDLNDGIPF